MPDPFQEKINDAIQNPQNMGEMSDADSVGTVGSADCGDMVRMWLKFSEKEGQKIIDKASFQSFGCQTAIAVASMATELLKGKTIEEARNLSAEELSQPIGPLPPMKIHCGQMVEGALKEALAEDQDKIPPPESEQTPGLVQQFQPVSGGKIKITKLD
ncbi:MAG: iron-sulfur cluster assembly scaffold protein [Verrucomicrobiota bacterium]